MKKAKKKMKRSASPKATKPARKSSPARICPCGCGISAGPKDPGYGARLTIFDKSGYWRQACIDRLKLAEEEARKPKIDVSVRTVHYDDQYIPALCFRSPDALYAQCVTGDRVNGVRYFRISTRDHDRATPTQHGSGSLTGPYPVALFAKHMGTLAHNGCIVAPEARKLLEPLLERPLPVVASPAELLEAAIVRPLTSGRTVEWDEVKRGAGTLARTPKASNGASRTGGKDLIKALAADYKLPPEKIRAALRKAGLRAPYTSEAECRKALGGKPK